VRKCFQVAGLMYGDEGKGSVVDALVRHSKADLVVRYNGGPQAGHNVVTPEGHHHCFSQFGSGTFVPGVRTHLSRFMLVNPANMNREEAHLCQLGVRDAYDRTSVSENSLIVTPYQAAVNRIQLLLDGRHNSCGMGIGVAVSNHLRYGDNVLFAGDLRNGKKAWEKIYFLREVSRLDAQSIVGSWLSKKSISTDVYDAVNDELRGLVSYLRVESDYELMLSWAKKVRIVSDAEEKDILRSSDVAVFEGAQGVLLDEVHGEEGFNTWSNCTFFNADELVKGLLPEVFRIGVVRMYLTRHGDGPLRGEDKMLDSLYPEMHNEDCGRQGKFRRAHFDFELLKKSLTIVGGVDYLAVNHLDYPQLRSGFLFMLGEAFEKKILIRGYGPTALNKRFTEVHEANAVLIN